MKNNQISNQIFVGCPWKTVRNKYEKLIEKFIKKYPLSFIIIGRSGDQKAADLLEIIKEKLNNSSAAIFDATYGNANVSLEYGLAEASEIPRAIYKSQHRGSNNSSGDSAIISDLAGRRRNEYKTMNGLENLLGPYAKNQPYTIKFEKCLKKNFRSLKKGEKKRYRALALKIIHHLDDKGNVRRADIVQNLTSLDYKEKEITEWLKKLHSSRLIYCSEGRYSTVSII